MSTIRATTRIPALPLGQQIEPLYRAFTQRLIARGFSGDIGHDYTSRLAVATDNSAFQQMPQGVVFPRGEADITILLGLAWQPVFHGIRLVPRGGGTSTIGCALDTGLIVDCSRHMNAIIELDGDAGWVRVQPGVVLDQLNDWLAAHGVFFAPDVAPGDRATLGGMANTDACGKGSRVHGKTSDHVLASRVVLSDASVLAAERLDPEALARQQARADLTGHIHREVAATVSDNRAEIARVFPDLTRYLSGYNLAHVFDDHGGFNLNKLICGSEGTLAIVSELTLRLTPLPQRTVLFALRYASFDAALRGAQRLVEYQPSAIESVDDKILRLARDNPVYARVRDMIEAADGSTPGAINLVEFSAAPGQDIEAAIADFQRFVDNTAAHYASGYYRADTPAARAALWDLRKAGVGLLGSTPGARKPLPFVEDTVVDPSVLADYVCDFRAILDAHGLEYGMFGHVDVGCLHVRPALDLCDPDDERTMRTVMDDVERLVRGYGGLVWNEHGKGYRSQYNPDYFGATLYAALGRIKRAFDPHYQLNPGKIVVPEAGDEPLAHMGADKRGHYDRQIPARQRQSYASALACNGNGACFSYAPADIMCPSYRVTRDRVHSPKGRAAAMREWLRQVSNTAPAALNAPLPRAPGLVLAAVADAGKTLLRRRPADDDLSHQVWMAMDGCLSCRACATQCPVKVDVPGFKSRFLALYHRRYPRPPADYALALLEPGAQRLARMPRLANRIIASRAARAIMARAVGIHDPPRLSVPGLAVFLRRHPEYRFTRPRFDALTQAQRKRSVFIVPDAFTCFFDVEVVIATLRLLAQLGFRPLVLAFQPNGKPLQVKGFAARFKHTAERMAAHLRAAAGLGVPLVGIEPSVTLTYREEYPATLGVDAVPKVLLLQEWLAANLPENGGVEAPRSKRYILFQHCTAATACPQSAAAWRTIFEHFNLALDTARLGCCGMSGAYGHETRHQHESRGIFDMSWAPALEYATTNDQQVLVPGYSCRTQIRRLQGQPALHPAQALLRAVQATGVPR